VTIDSTSGNGAKISVKTRLSSGRAILYALTLDPITIAVAGRPVRPPLYARIMRQSWATLSAPVRSLHETDSPVRAYGDLRIDGGGQVARFAARLLRLPGPGAAVRTFLTIVGGEGFEHWRRVFGECRVATRQYEAGPRELAERFGILEIRFRLDARDGSLHYIQRRARFRAGPVRVRIPAALAPRVEAREDPAGPDRIRIAVDIALPGIGRLIAYSGIIHVEGSRS